MKRVPADQPVWSAAQQAREAFGARLREIRVGAGLTSRDLAAHLGRHPSKISRIERGQVAPSLADLRAWCTRCDALDQLADLTASLQTIESMYVEWRRVMRTGMRRVQQSYLPLHERTRLTRIYEPGVIPGVLQTGAYATALMARAIERHRIPDDLDEAVAARLERQSVMLTGGRRMAVVLEEMALRSRIGSADMMAGQLGHLLSVASMPAVSLAVIPQDRARTIYAQPAFWIYDEERVIIETPTAELTITQPHEVGVYLQVFAELSAMAVTGAAARSLIGSAIGSIAE